MESNFSKNKICQEYRFSSLYSEIFELQNDINQKDFKFKCIK